MNKKKLFNDPIYGFITLRHEILYDLIAHPYFQRLRRISQVGLTHYVYPGALHTRFHHALGAVHLMGQAIDTIRGKGHDLSDEEAEAVSIAILLHDIGHGPFSHALEGELVKVHHETLSLAFMEKLNREYGGKLDLAIRIFKGDYHKPFLHQLVSGQLDMDRLDYLTRDSFFTGVYEGVVGYDRIIKMLNVHQGELVVEEKGIYSIEKFLTSRRLMYWQVYFHKTCIAAEKMLVHAVKRAKELTISGNESLLSGPLDLFFRSEVTEVSDEILENFSLLDDVDVLFALKKYQNHPDSILSFLSKSIINRQLFKSELTKEPINEHKMESIRASIMLKFDLKDEKDLQYLMYVGSESNNAYSAKEDEIVILYKDGRVKPISESFDSLRNSQINVKNYLCYPKNIS